jgi:hypothetical protein
MSSRRRRGIVIAVVVTLLVACVAAPLVLRMRHRAAVAARLTSLDVPVYPGATGLERVFDDSFVPVLIAQYHVPVPYPSSKVLTFYDRHFRGLRWAPVEDGGSAFVRRWTRRKLYESSPPPLHGIDQKSKVEVLMATWRRPDAAITVRVTILSSPGQRDQEVQLNAFSR